MFTMENELNRLYFDAVAKNSADIEALMETCDLQKMADSLTHVDSGMDGLEYEECLRKFIQALNYIEESTEIATPVSDLTYDQLVETYESYGASHLELPYQEVASEQEGTGYHKYPEIRGTLGKVHFIHRDEIPEDDSRKSLEDYYYSTRSAIEAAGYQVPKTIMVVCAMKFDGTSQVFECEGDHIERVLTRYKVELNLGKDVTHVYKGSDFQLDIPDYFKKLPAYGVKTECYMKQSDFDRYKVDFGDPKCNRRSAITSIVNRSEDRMDHELLQYISVRPFQVSSPDHIEIPDWDPVKNPWYYCGLINDHHQWIWTGGFVTKCVNFCDPKEFLDIVSYHIPLVQEEAANESIPIDGVVVTLLHQDIIKALGRKNDVNKFQIAYKIPAGVKKTVLKGVQFQVGPITGAITPVAIVEPVVINGSTITNPTLSNFDKMERLDLHIGDEMKIQYDIIPKIFKDSECKVNRKEPQIMRITECPLCGELLENDRCVNPNCTSKIPGRIYNYVKKIGIRGFGKQTVKDLVDAGILRDIPDLYRLELHRERICNLPGFGETTFHNLARAVMNRLELYPHEILGSVGIPDIATKTTKLICQKYSLPDLIEDPNGISDKLITIPGIGEKKAVKLEEGILQNRETLQYVLNWVTIKDYPKETYEKTITFTNVRDKDFETYLKGKGVEVVDSWVSRVSMVVIPDGGLAKESTKVKKAREANIPILELKKAKSYFEYKG